MSSSNPRVYSEAVQVEVVKAVGAITCAKLVGSWEDFPERIKILIKAFYDGLDDAMKEFGPDSK